MVEKSDESVIDQTSGYIVVAKVDEFEESPDIEDGKNCFFDSKEALVKFTPLVLGIVPFFFLVLAPKDDVLEFFGFETFDQTVTRLLHQIILSKEA